MGVLKKAILVIILAYVSKFIYLFLVTNGIGVHFNNVRPGSCRVIPGIDCGSEQISITSDGLAFITNGYRDLTNCDRRYLTGNIFLFDFTRPSDNVKKLTIISKTLDLSSFDPHGMDIYETDKEVKIYLVNHANGKESVEVFNYNRNVPDQIEHIKSITNDKFVCLNDLTVVNEDEFYLTNYLKYCKLTKLALLMESLLGMKSANVVYYNSSEAIVVAENGAMFNGITLSKDKSKVLVAEGGTLGVSVFERLEESGLLIAKTKVFIGHKPDNIFLDKQSGMFYVAYFKKPFNLLMNANNRSEYSDIGGARLHSIDSKWDKFDIQEVLYDSGKDFVSGASSLVHYKGKYLIGTVFDKLGYCEVV